MSRPSSLQFRFAKMLAPLVLTLNVPGFVACAEDQPDFYATFDNSTQAVNSLNKPITPCWESALKFVPGVRGNAVFIGDSGKPGWKTSPGLQYPAASFFSSEAGTIMFWVRPDWDGASSSMSINRFLQVDNAIDVLMYTKLNTTFRSGPTEKGKGSSVELSTPGKASWLKGDWWHVAITWDSKGWIKQYVNGLPYATGYSYLRKVPILKQPLDFGGLKTMAVGSTLEERPDQKIRANAAFDELKIFRRSLTDDQIVAEYRKSMPLDIIMERRYVRANQPEKINLDIWPGGQMTRPLVGQLVPLPVQGQLSLKIIRESDSTTIAQLAKDLDLRERLGLEVPLPNLSEGSYRIICQFTSANGTSQKSFFFFAFSQQPAPEESDAPLQLGDPVVTIDVTKPDPAPLFDKPTTLVESPLGVYREASSARDARFSYELDFSKVGPLTGQPMLLEVYWPDDKPRSMGLYLYRKSNQQQNRDRLAGGIQSGEEFGLSNNTQVSRYLFYTWVDRYLFEARTMVNDYPAAVAKIVVRPVLGRLPKLRIDRPINLPERSFGNLDEDQTFEALLGLDNPDPVPQRRVVKNVEMLLDYMDYTGQNVFAHPYTRYSDAMYELPGTLGGYGGYLESNLGARLLLLDMFEQRQKKCFAMINSIVNHEAKKLPHLKDELTTSGYFLRDRNGKVIERSFLKMQVATPVHPRFRREYFGHIDEILRRFGHHPSFAGIEIWQGDWQIRDLESGYDDITVELFEKETGLHVPGGNTETRFSSRHAFLTGPHRAAWLEWRARKNTEFLREVAGKVNACNPKLRCNIAIGGIPAKWSKELGSSDDVDFAKYYFEDQSLDLPALAKLPGVVLTVMRWPSGSRWQRHRDNAFVLTDEIQGDLEKQKIFRYGNPIQVDSYLHYFEARKPSLKNDVFNTMFANADVKAHGRHFLKEMSESVSGLDPETILVGAQPLGTSGRDDEAREFARAFRALPAGNFKEIPGLLDPICGRFLTTQQGTYFYLQNRVASETKVELQADSEPYLDLSLGTPIPTRDKICAIALKPFELRAFKSESKTASIQVKSVQVPEAFRKSMEHLYAVNASVVQLMKDHEADTVVYDNLLKRFRENLDAGRYAETHRLAFSKLLRGLPAQAEIAKRGYPKRQKEMIAARHWAIDCGSNTFHETAEGVLFFPDQPYKEGGYGYVGESNVAMHSTDKLETPVDKTILASEAFDIVGYAFTVPNGEYTVKLYNRIGYVPDAKPGACVMTLSIQGKKVWDKMDLYLALGQEIKNALVSEFRNIKVTNGVLRLNWSRTNGRLGWINAIEVMPEAQSADLTQHR